jgi:uncharacterized protein (TIGR02266 family)
MDQGSSAARLIGAPRDSYPSGVSNRRSSPRVALEVEITLSSDSQFFAGLSGDMSEGGLFVATYRQLPVGAHVAIDLALPDGSLHVEGEVRWARAATDGSPPGFGVAFTGLSAQARARVESFCRARAPLYVDDDG